MEVLRRQQRGPEVCPALDTGGDVRWVQALALEGALDVCRAEVAGLRSCPAWSDAEDALAECEKERVQSCPPREGAEDPRVVCSVVIVVDLLFFLLWLCWRHGCGCCGPAGPWAPELRQRGRRRGGGLLR